MHTSTEPDAMLEIVININNAAFEGDNAPHEVARILRALADKFEANGTVNLTSTLRDINGNRCGQVRLMEY